MWLSSLGGAGGGAGQGGVLFTCRTGLKGGEGSEKVGQDVRLSAVCKQKGGRGQLKNKKKNTPVGWPHARFGRRGAAEASYRFAQCAVGPWGGQAELNFPFSSMYQLPRNCANLQTNLHSFVWRIGQVRIKKCPMARDGW